MLENDTGDPAEMQNPKKKLIDCGLVIIGDEILKGHCKDTNAEFLLSRLWSNGVQVRKVSFISDDVDEIAKEVAEFSSRFSFVITSGGIGPTHDDKTFKGIAKAFNETLVTNLEIERMVLDFGASKSVASKMATVPNSTVLSIAKDLVTMEPEKYPLLSVANVYIFPGVPEFLMKLFTNHKATFTGNGKFLLTKVYLSVEEAEVAHVLDDVSKRFPEVHVGSYPVLHDAYKVKVTLETDEGDDLTCAYAFLIENLPKGSIVSVKKCKPNSRDGDLHLDQGQQQRRMSFTPLSSLSLLDMEHLLSSKNRSSLSAAVKCAWAVLNQTLLTYSPSEVCVAFNGGKDCTVVLHLFIAFMKKAFPNKLDTLKALYIQPVDPLDETQHFIDACASNYNIEIITIPGSVRGGLEKLSKINSNIKVVVMGTRRQDPYSLKLRSFVMTDPHWPQYMRAFPILDWTYAEVWQFLRSLSLPYCSLYDEGYTSLGSLSSTTKNPSLLKSDGTYLPAYALSEEQLERAGRTTK